MQMLPQTGNEYLADVIDTSFVVSFVSYIEFLGYPQVSVNMESFIKLAEVIEIDKEIIQQTITLRKIKKIKLPDAIIAATAIAHSFTLISRNTRDFKNIEGLDVINPHELHN